MKIRVAIGVRSNGEWIMVGRSNSADTYLCQMVLEDGDLARIHFAEVEVPDEIINNEIHATMTPGSGIVSATVS